MKSVFAQVIIYENLATVLFIKKSMLFVKLLNVFFVVVESIHGI